MYVARDVLDYADDRIGEIKRQSLGVEGVELR